MADLSDRYTLSVELASGGMGEVFVANDNRLGRRVAVKLLRPELAADARFVERFRREARSVAALSHPNIAAVFDYGEDDDRQYIVMELVDGRDLARVLREDGPLPHDRAFRIAAQIADALAHAHAAGTVHRDIKPGNVILMEEDRVKVTDFGIARAVGDSTITATGSVLGTAHYVSPEQASGGNVGPASDIYSLGVVLYETLTGQLPFTGESLVAVAMRHLSDEMPAPSEQRSGIPPEVDRVVAIATAKDPRDRPDAAGLARELRSAMTRTPDETIVSPTEEATTVWPIPGDRWDPERVGRWALAILGGLAVIAAGLLLFRLATAEPASKKSNRPNQAPAGAPEATASETPVEEEGFEIPEEFIGVNYHEVEKFLKEAGFLVLKLPVDDTPFEHDEIASTQPEPGNFIQPGDTITLHISTGESSESGDEGDEPPGKSHGHDKHDKDD